MLIKEEIEKAKEKLKEIKEFWLNYNYATEEGKKSLIENAESIETLLQYIEQLENENKQLNISYKLMENEAMRDGLEERKKLNKIIEKMSKQLAGLTIFDIEKDEPIILGDKEEVKKYFEEQVKEK